MIPYILMYSTGLYYPLFDSWYFWLVIPALLLSLLASAGVRRAFARYSQVTSRSGYTGQRAARHILDRSGLMNVAIERTPGQLTDHYDPKSRILRLSESTYSSQSIAAVGVAAHEAGHAIQHEDAFWPNTARGYLVPVARIGSSIGPYLAIFGLLANLSFLTAAGIVLFTGAVLFYLVTLPVEFDASRRAIRILESEDMLNAEELTGAKKVLRAAAMTYIASALVAFASLLRLILLARGRSGRR